MICWKIVKQSKVSTPCENNVLSLISDFNVDLIGWLIRTADFETSFEDDSCDTIFLRINLLNLDFFKKIGFKKLRFASLFIRILKDKK